MFPIVKIPNFWTLMTEINNHPDLDKLGSVSKVIALLILDRHRKMFSKMFEKKYPLRLFPNPRVIDVNECVLVRIPNLIENLTYYLSKHGKKLNSCHSIVSRIMRIGQNITPRMDNEGEAENASFISPNLNMGMQMDPPFSFNYGANLGGNSDYSSSSFEIRYSSTQSKVSKIEELIKNTEIAELVFNSPRFDTLKVRNIHVEAEESKDNISFLDSSFGSSSISSLSENSISSLNSLFSNNSPSEASNANLNSVLINITNVEFLNKITKSSIVEVLFVLSKLMFGSK